MTTLHYYPPRPAQSQFFKDHKPKPCGNGNQPPCPVPLSDYLPMLIVFGVALAFKYLRNIRTNPESKETQCDGCKAGIPFNEHNNHQKPNDPTDRLGMGCTAHLYDKPRIIDGKIIICVNP